jgi:hypothetical protein
VSIILPGKSRFSLTSRAPRSYNGRVTPRTRGQRFTVMAAALATSLVSGVAIITGVAGGASTEVRTAVSAYLAHVAATHIADMIIDRTVTIYDPQRPYVRTKLEQRIVLKPPRRQRVEQVADGDREIRLTVGDRAWVRRRDGATEETAASSDEHRLMQLLLPFGRATDDLLREWRAFGVRDDVSHATRVAQRRALVIGARADDRNSPAVWLDEDLGVLRLVRRERVPNGVRLVDESFSEHRPLVGALSFPYRQEMFVDGKLVMLIVVRAVFVNTDPPAHLFDPASLR